MMDIGSSAKGGCLMFENTCYRADGTAGSRSRKTASVTLSAILTLIATGCHHHKQQTYAPPPPPLRSYPSHRNSESNQSKAAIQKPSQGPVTEPEGKPILVETGMASWYGPSGHAAADGSPYDGTGMTAAHKTLPLGTVARVTNLVNGESVMVRITDRGPFAHGRVLDLSESAAKEIGLYRMGMRTQLRARAANGAFKPEPSRISRMRST
jgi:rare lipoprotein A